jgi:putative oxidoreductase
LNLSFLDRVQPLGFFILRVVLGVIMVVHGYHKVFGGLHHHAQFVASLGMPAWLGYVSAFTEFLGGIGLIAGVLTRFAAFAVCIDMCVAIAKVHWHNGLTGQGGFEFPLSLAAIAFALIFTGAGPISVDWLTGRK